MKNTNLFLSEKELSRAKALEEKLLKSISKHNTKRNQCDKYYKKLEDGLSDSDRNLLKRYYFLDQLATKLYVEKLRNNIKKSQKFLWENGIFTFKAPIGYKNCKDEKGRAHIEVDIDRLPIIYRLFLDRRDGESIKALKNTADIMGLTYSDSKKIAVSEKYILRILHNKFYAGKMVINGKTYQHKYPIMVPPELFEEVQQTFKERRLKWKI